MFPQATSHRLLSLGVALTIAVLLATASYALPPGADLEPILSGEGERIVSSSGETLHQTSVAVRGLRTLAAGPDDLEIHLWDETSAAGVATSYYAISRGGSRRGRAREASYAVELADFTFDPLTDSQPALAAGLQADPDNRLRLVQLWATPLPELQEQITDLGAVIHRYYTQFTLMVEMDEAARASVAALPFVRWVGDYHPGYRVEGFLREALEADGITEGRYSIALNLRGDAAQRELAERIKTLGGEVNVFTPDSFRMEATLNQEQLLAIARDNRVHYIDRWGPGGHDMDIVREVGGADYVEGITGYSGEGVTGEVFDTEILTTHQEWLNPIDLHSVGTSSGCCHGTSSASNVFAQGISPLARGMAPDGQGVFFLHSEATQFGGPTTRATIAEELLDPAGPYRAVFQTSSVGNDRTTEYTTISAEMDDVLFEHQIVHTQSQSNAGNQDSRPQAWAKNIVSVGGFRHQSTADRLDDHWGFSASIGPAADGRIKPDLAYFYDSIFSASGSGPTAYTSFGGTSSATPQTAGHFAIMFQMWHEGEWPGHGGAGDVFDSRPNMITAKALVIHHAFRYDWNSGGANADIDRFKQGWGTADLANLFDNAEFTRVFDEETVLEPLESFSTSVLVGSGVPEFKATMSYLDPMGTPGAGVHRINDLSLKVTSPSGTEYWGNNGLDVDNVSTSGGVSNTIDTVENVFVVDPEAGEWTVEVFADEVVQDSHVETAEVDADFSLILSPDGDNIFVDGFESGDTSAWAEVEQ